MSTTTEKAENAGSLQARIRKSLPWTQKIGSAIMDQAVFAGANFIIGVLVARWLTPEENGAYALAFSWYLLLVNLYDALVIDPISYYGSKKYSGRFQRYLGIVVYGHFGVALVMAVGLGLGGLFMMLTGSHQLQFPAALSQLQLRISTILSTGSTLIGYAMLGAAIATPMMLLRSLSRIPFYVKSTPHWSVLGGVVYLIVSVVGCFVLHEMGQLSAFSALVMMGVGTLASALTAAFIAKPTLRPEPDDLSMRQIVQDHVEYGKWSLGSRFLSWLSSNSGYLVVPLLASLADNGSLRAITNLVLPIALANSAIVSLLVPIFARTHQHQGEKVLDQRVTQICRMVFLVTGSYFLFLTVFGKPVIHLLFDGKYDEAATLPFIMTMALIPVITTLSRIHDAALAAMGRNKLTFQAKIIPTALVVVLDVILVSAFGLIGYNLESLITAALTLFFVRTLYVRYRDGKANNPPEPHDAASMETPAPVAGESV